MSSIQQVYKWASGSIALVPGFAIILTDLGTPPDISKVLYGGIVEACGSFTFIMLFLNKKKIANSTDRKINVISTTMFALFILSLLSYVLLYNNQVVYSSRYDQKIFFPFWYKGDLQYMIAQAGSKLKAISDYGPQAIADAITNSQPYLAITTLIFTLLYVSMFEYLVIGLGLAGFKASVAETPPESPDSK